MSNAKVRPHYASRKSFGRPMAGRRHNSRSSQMLRRSGWVSMLVTCALAWTATAALAQSNPVDVSVTIRANEPGPTINPNIYGQFAEHLGAGIYEGVWVGEKSRIPNTNGYR